MLRTTDINTLRAITGKIHLVTVRNKTIKAECKIQYIIKIIKTRKTELDNMCSGKNDLPDRNPVVCEEKKVTNL